MASDPLNDLYYYLECEAVELTLHVDALTPPKPVEVKRVQGRQIWVDPNATGVELPSEDEIYLLDKVKELRGRVEELLGHVAARKARRQVEQLINLRKLNAATDD